MHPDYQLVKIWDPMIRIWHWALVASVVSGWLLGEFRTFSTVQFHMYAGYTTCCLLLFRIYWGFAGPSAVRFSALAVTRASIRKYLDNMFVRQPSGVPGHNPIGALSVIAMLLLLVTQVITGLFSEDDGLFFEGPLAYKISDGLVLKMTSLHSFNSKVILFVVIVHVCAILFYLIWKKENLIRAMFTGWKLVKRQPVKKPWAK